MSISDQTARAIIGHLSFQLAKGWGAFCVAKNIQKAIFDKRINCAVNFLVLTRDASLETAILALSKIIVFDKDSINIQYLLNFAEQNYQLFSRADRPTVINFITQHRQQLQNISATIDNIKEQRDRTLAHLDKKHITNPLATHTHPPLTNIEVEETFRLLLNIVNTYSGFLTPSEETRLERIEPDVTEDWNYLSGLLEQDNLKKKRRNNNANSLEPPNN